MSVSTILPVNRPISFHHPGKRNHITLTRKIRRMDDQWLLYRGPYDSKGYKESYWIPPANWRLDSFSGQVTVIPFEYTIRNNNEALVQKFDATTLTLWKNT